ncbi:MAG: hypothetical protein ACXWIP_07745, partial [Burkholderiales bacterium]
TVERNDKGPSNPQQPEHGEARGEGRGRRRRGRRDRPEHRSDAPAPESHDAAAIASDARTDLSQENHANTSELANVRPLPTEIDSTLTTAESSTLSHEERPFEEEHVEAFRPQSVEVHRHEVRPEPPETVEKQREQGEPELVNEMPQSSTPLVGSAPRFEAVPEPAAVPAEPAQNLKLEWPSDLVQVETDPLKAREAAAYVEAEPRRVSRVRPDPVPVSDDPLVQVETRSRVAPAAGEAASASLGERETANSVGHV